ncbi:MAG: hypothetical protein KDA65_03195 [Planctomycetaceae bacterium]|nr:hypothetical protein [Planctomycetaceae bacterium]
MFIRSYLLIVGLILASLASPASTTNKTTERTLPVLLQKLDQSLDAVEEALDTNNQAQLEPQLRQAYVQTISAAVQLRVDLKQYGPVPGIKDITPGESDLPTWHKKLSQRRSTLIESPTCSANQSTLDTLYELVPILDQIYCHAIQKNCVYPEGDQLAGVGACFEQEGEIAYMAGVIDDRIVSRVHQLLCTGTIRKIVMVYVPGSWDDGANLAAALKLHRANIATHVITGGTLESGGVDFYLAGTQRTLDEHSLLGVHSWEGNHTTGYDLRFNREHRDHERPYLRFYREIKIPAEFYFFTLKYKPEEMHYMTQEEMERYGW